MFRGVGTNSQAGRNTLLCIGAVEQCQNSGALKALRKDEVGCRDSRGKRRGGGGVMMHDVY